MSPEDETRLRLIRLDRWFQKRPGWQIWLDAAGVGISIGLLGVLIARMFE